MEERTPLTVEKVRRSVSQCSLRSGEIWDYIEYGAPMDEQEMDRIDMAHAKYFMLLNKQRHLAPIGTNPQKVLDLACGTGNYSSVAWLNHETHRWKGIWSIDFADEFPSADVSREWAIEV